ncbi:MAG: hypothetical protein R3B70_23750 [Polyangiaceae bacterium]
MFALKHPQLRAARRAFLVAPYNIVLEAERAGLTDDESREYLAGEARQFDGCAFSAAILDVLGIAP